MNASHKSADGVIEVVVVGSTRDAHLADLSFEAERIRASLLYGDHVSLLSPKILALHARMVWRMRRIPQLLRQLDLEDQPRQEWNEALDQVWDSVESRTDWAISQGLAGGDVDNFSFFVELPEALAQMLRDDGERDPPTTISPSIFPVAVENYRRKYSGEPSPDRAFKDLAILANQGLLTLRDSPTSYGIASAEAGLIDQAYGEALEAAVELFREPTGHNHPVVSRAIAGDMRRKIAEHQGLHLTFTNANRAQIATQMLGLVPGFPDASIDEILDLRSRIQPHLARFRSAVAEFEDSLTSDILDAEFSSDVVDVYTREVAPYLETVKASIHDEGAYPALLRGVPKLAVGAIALGTAVVAGSGVFGALAAASGGVAVGVAAELLRRHEAQVERARHRLFLLYLAGEHIESSRP